MPSLRQRLSAANAASDDVQGIHSFYVRVDGSLSITVSVELSYGADTGTSRGDPCRPALRPFEASKAAVCYVRLRRKAPSRASRPPPAGRGAPTVSQDPTAADGWARAALAQVDAQPREEADAASCVKRLSIYSGSVWTHSNSIFAST